MSSIRGLSGSGYTAAMGDQLLCYRCGASLDKLTLPLSRQDQCPSCANYLHVCRMCEFHDPAVPAQCTEEDAEEVFEKERPNFCDYFKPSSQRFDSARAAGDARARDELAALFGDGEAAKADDDKRMSDAEDLFK